jgi:hypothetical protein
MKEITRINDADIMYNAITNRLGTATTSEEEQVLKKGILEGLGEITRRKQEDGLEAVTMLAVRRKRRWFRRKRK